MPIIVAFKADFDCNWSIEISHLAMLQPCILPFNFLQDFISLKFQCVILVVVNMFKKQLKALSKGTNRFLKVMKLKGRNTKMKEA